MSPFNQRVLGFDFFSFFSSMNKINEKKEPLGLFQAIDAPGIK
jgi:hypothetical protein